MRGKSSGLLAFDAVLLSATATNGNRSNERDDETGFKCTKLVKHRPSVTPVPTGSPNDSSNGFHFDPSMSTLNESSLTQNASALRGAASNEANTEQNSSRRMRFSLSELGCSSTFNSVDVCNSARLNSGSGRMPLSTVEPGCSSQEGSCVIDIPSSRQYVPESCNGGIIDNTKLTVGQQLLATMPRTHTPGPGQLLVLRGLRVRMGMASGVERQEDVHLNSAQGRVQYSGPAMAAAKAVVDAAQGGMVLISPETFQQIPAKLLREKILVASMGEHKLGKGQGQICLQLYQVLPRQLVHRAAQLGPVRSIQQLSHGFLEAPSNRAAICFMTVSYLKALEQWNPDVTAAALELWQTIVQGILMKCVDMRSQAQTRTTFSVKSVNSVGQGSLSLIGCLV
ncbi:hypothetical protein DUNSADRAFT_13849 [Dunaliella salina]|uniref:Uncharacterized protein n=1 Tax=Dunaliella salina TaxID=3046 RepID=A0ABQ7G8J2_DUNSA|nr:hypothetical protein DUNSADRAFT_13849 [Dunaliella salina]|eukprot:KAF5830917.1 hypothetical protein DUNSADRAFT_13849 [Dunaliella salina]